MLGLSIDFSVAIDSFFDARPDLTLETAKRIL